MCEMMRSTSVDNTLPAGGGNTIGRMIDVATA